MSDLESVGWPPGPIKMIGMVTLYQRDPDRSGWVSGHPGPLIECQRQGSPGVRT
jgi:hypothetical protein